MVDLMRFLMGDALSVYSRQENLFHKEVNDYTVAHYSVYVLGIPQGRMVLIYDTNGATPNRWLNECRVLIVNLTTQFTDHNYATFPPTSELRRQPQVID